MIDLRLENEASLTEFPRIKCCTPLDYLRRPIDTYEKVIIRIFNQDP